MNQQVIEKLKKIEQTENIRILHAIESGSRAWGFASEDSDFDVRFLYIRSSEQYLLLEKTRDVLEYPVDTVWDINGWDLQKALRLLHRCNTTLIE
ncbi:MAG TPA: nucleotidyltransferase domain-containing protein, partial [Candidatus Coprocola pullicola]|nr:nucleotidyltransferase domain-containing protein [Candidatus Coprocola pullicola]